MTERIKQLLSLLRSGEFRNLRTHNPFPLTEEEKNLPIMEREVLFLRRMLEAETPIFYPGDRVGFHRSNTEYPVGPNRDGKMEPMWSRGNVIPDFETVLNTGLDAILAQIEEKLSTCEASRRPFLTAARDCVKAALDYADREAKAAAEQGFTELADSLSRVPHGKAETLHDACVFLQFLIFTLRCNRNTHIPLARFDRYMRPFYQRDLGRGITRETLLESVEELFIHLNFDADLYYCMQLGDSGQSLVLGGNGTFDDFSVLCMEASLELQIIDPKINLRVDKNTPDSVYELGSRMTAQGLGFPQYCNDDVVIPALVRMGYAPEDAADYAVAACWEFIIPGKSMDIPNIRNMSFPLVLEQVLKDSLPTAANFEELMQAVEAGIVKKCDELMQAVDLAYHPNPNINVGKPVHRHHIAESPYLSVFLCGCIENERDLSELGAPYNNFGCHGTGLSTAADALAAVREVVFETKECSPETLLDCLNKDFEGYEDLRRRLLACPKMGSGDDRVDAIGRRLMEFYGGYLTGKPAPTGGIFRAGTGSANGYIGQGLRVGATPDGRKAYAPFASSFSPSQEAKPAGPLSCIRSFTGFDLKNCMNGGPLTMELSDSVFRNEMGIQKTAQLVKAFIHLGGHQLQLNCISRETLMEAEQHPELHKDLIVRVWGWSGYFVELDEPYRKHILGRTAHTL